MDKDEQTLWELFCTTGEPKYYSMYVRAKDKTESENGEIKDR